MKDFTVIVGAPDAENEKNAEKSVTSSGKKDKVKIDIGGILDLISNFLDSCESRFIEMEKKEDKAADASGLKPYVVILEAVEEA